MDKTNYRMATPYKSVNYSIMLIRTAWQKNKLFTIYSHNSMKKKLLFIINPISGIGKQQIVEKLLAKELDTSKFDYEISYTKYPKHAIEISKNATNQYDAVVAVGGDGSVNEVCNGLVGSKTVLGVLPVGSGNGFAHYMKISTNLTKAIHQINDFKIKDIDSISFGDRNYINVAGVGFDAEVSHRFAEYGKRGFFSYVKVINRVVYTYKPKYYHIVVDGVEIKQRAFSISFANSSEFGNHAHVAPLAVIDDGFIDVCIVSPFPKLMLPIMVIHMYIKTLHKSIYTKTIKAKKVQFFITDRQEVHLDGEPIVFDKDLTIEINPLSIKVIHG